jgi:hypothetical protein
MKRLTAIVIFLCLPVFEAHGDEPLDVWKGSYRFSYETLMLPQREAMSLAGLQYLTDFSPRLYAGAGVFGAISGRRGGFFVGGLEAGIRQNILPALFAEAGFFAGAGGGGGAPQGGGLMLRPHVGIWYDMRSVRAGVLYSRIDFPNGKINSGQIGFALDVPFETLLVSDGYQGDLSTIVERASRIAGQPLGFARDYLGPFYQVYFPATRVKNTKGRTRTEPFGTFGLEAGRCYDERFSLFTAVAGAVAGSAAGYAELFAGAGYRLPLSGSGEKKLFLDWRAAAGAAGGGRVDTGGGVVMKTSLGLKALFRPELAANMSGGYAKAMDGSFSAAVVTFDVTYFADTASFGPKNATAVDSLYLSSYQAGMTQQTYLTRDPRIRKSPDSTPVSLVGIRIHRALTDSLAVTAQASGAYDGSAGGYAVGLLGLRLTSSPVVFQALQLFLDASAGAAGGGGIPVGGGAVVQGAAGILCTIAGKFSFEASYGMIAAVNGPLDSSFIEAGLLYRFSTLNRRISPRSPTR